MLACWQCWRGRTPRRVLLTRLDDFRCRCASAALLRKQIVFCAASQHRMRACGACREGVSAVPGLPAVDKSWRRSCRPDCRVRACRRCGVRNMPVRCENLQVVECPICLMLLCEPITTPCGHSFCRPCLVSTLRKTKKKCPSCRAVCHLEAETHSENITLVNVVRASFPALYEARREDIQKEKANWDKILPIFFYNDTLFPYSPLSLHLFEPRYRVMCKRIVNGGRKFAYLPCYHSYSAAAGDIGVVADLTDVEFLPDGRALLQAKCKDRFRVLEAWVEDGTQGLHWCRVELLPDLPAPTMASSDGELGMGGAAHSGRGSGPCVVDMAAECSEMFEVMLERFGGLRSEIEATHGPKPGEDAEKLSFWLAAVLPLNYTHKHALLTTRSTLTRLRVLKTFMDEHISRRGARDNGLDDGDDEGVEIADEIEGDVGDEGARNSEEEILRSDRSLSGSGDGGDVNSEEEGNEYPDNPPTPSLPHDQGGQEGGPSEGEGIT